MKSKTLINIFLFVVLSSAVLLAQNNNSKKTVKTVRYETIKEGSTGNIKTPQATGDEINFKDDDGNSLITITDEGATGSITIPSAGSAPSSTTNKLYNIGSTLYFNGSSLGSGGGVSAINDLSDAKYDGYSLFLGTGAGANDDGGNYNTAVGKYTLYSNTSGSYNTGIGNWTLYLNMTGSNNTTNGYAALYSNTSGIDNTANGSDALYSNTTGYYNTANGYRALYSNTTASANVANGYAALSSNSTGFENTANGAAALFSNTTGNKNVVIGYSASYYNQTGSNNTIIGSNAGIGSYGHSESGNVFLGYEAGYFETGSNLLYIENTSTSSPLIWGDFFNNRIVINGNSANNSSNRTFFVNGQAGGNTGWYNDSDKRLKKNIKTIPHALKKVKELRGVNFEWKNPKKYTKGLQMGFIAQEAEKVIPEVVDTSGSHYTMQYAPITALLVEAVKDQQKIIAKQKSKIEEEENVNASQQKELNKLETEIIQIEKQLSSNKFTDVNN